MAKKYFFDMTAGLCGVVCDPAIGFPGKQVTRWRIEK